MWYLQGIRGAVLSDAQQDVVVRFVQQHLQAYSPALLVQLLDDVPYHAIHIYPYLRQFVEAHGLEPTNQLLEDLCAEVVRLTPSRDASAGSSAPAAAGAAVHEAK